MSNNYLASASGAQPAILAPRDKHFASNTRANMARDVWNDYQTRFQPVERELLDMVQNPEQLLDERLAAITINSDAAYSAAMTTADQTRGRYGIAMTPEQAAAEGRNLGLSKTLGEIDARNNTRTHIADRNMQVIGGGSGGTRQAIQEM